MELSCILSIVILVLSTLQFDIFTAWNTDLDIPDYIVWGDEIYDDIIPYEDRFIEPCQAAHCHDPYVDDQDPQERVDEEYELMNRNESLPALEAFKRGWADPWAERPTGHEHYYDRRYLDMINRDMIDQLSSDQYMSCHGPACRSRGKRAIAEKKVTVRKEYRTMTKEEKDRFHKAIQALKASGGYDAVAKRHKIQDAPGAHFGPAFLLWHRYYLLQLEIALQLIDPLVFIPFWDSSLESRLGYNFKESCLFDSHSLGQWKSGVVTDGAFANFKAYKGCTTTGKVITRRVSRNTLFTTGDLNRYKTYRKFRQLAGSSDLEDTHGFVHVAVGGHLGNLNCAPVDPLFFMHHAFVDYIFWLFRKTQKGDKTTDYVPYKMKNHRLNDTMKPFKGVKNKDGLKPMPLVSYEESPSIKRCKHHTECRSDMLWCDRGRCTAKVRVGTWCRRRNPASCFCENNANPSCAGKKVSKKKKRRRRQRMKCVCTDPTNPTNEGNTATPTKVLAKAAAKTVTKTAAKG